MMLEKEWSCNSPLLKVVQMGVNVLSQPKEEVSKTTSNAPRKVVNPNSSPQ